MKYGLTLEGGGARGAYHIGAVKALVENGYEFKSVVGTSIGAVNAAFICQGDLDEVYNMWQTLSFSDLFNVEDDKIINAMNANLDLDTVKYLSKKMRKFIKEKGIDTLRMRKLLEEKIDEKKVRDSKIKFGLVTYCLSDRNGEELLIDDIEDGKLVDYLMASTNLPVFKRVKVNDKNYVDGGVYDNCPVNILERQGIKEAIVIRTYKRMRIRDYKKILKRGNVVMHMIEPVDSLPSILNFESKNLQEQLLLGYYDALKAIKNLDGIRYYIKEESEKDIIKKLDNISYDIIQKIADMSNIRLDVGKNITVLLKEKIIKNLAAKTRNKDLETIKDYIYTIMETVSLSNNIERYKVYTFDELLSEIKKVLKTEEKLNAMELLLINL